MAPRVDRAAAWAEQVEGPNAVSAALRAGRVRELLVAEGAHLGLAEAAREAGIPVRSLARGALAARAGTEAPQGVIALCRPIRPTDLATLLRQEPRLLVAVDGITDPRNLGAIARSAAAAGAAGALVPRHRNAALGPAAVKAAAGAVELLAWVSVTSLPEALARSREAGMWAVGLAAEATGSAFDCPLLDERVVLVVGGEEAGLGRLVRERCDALVSIPMAPHSESLNASAAATVALFEVVRRQRPT